MATAEQLRSRLRRDVGADSSSLSDSDADALIAEAEEAYGTGTDAAYAYARVLAIQGLLANSAKLASYRQNASSESLSDVYAHLEKQLALWERRTGDADGQSVPIFEVY